MKGKEKEARSVRLDSARRGFFWFLMLAGLVLIVYFTLNMAINLVFGIDSANQGVTVVTREPAYENGSLVQEGESQVLSGVSGWVAVFAPWLAVNAYYLALGALIFGIGYVMTPKTEERVPVSLLKMRMLACYLVLVALLMVILGLDRVYFLPRAAVGGALAWIDWYIFEFLAHIVWAVVLALMAAFLFRVGRRVTRIERVKAGPEPGSYRRGDTGGGGGEEGTGDER